MSQSITFESEIKVLLKTGKVILGSKKTIKALKLGKLKGVIIASTLRSDIKNDIMRYASLAGVPVVEYKGSGWELGTVVGKPFLISTVGVEELGDSQIMKLANQ
ncbi:50S ribosomal protein L30e [Metallosphaera sp. J1]|uniref:50S ribosomal protein L30e n=1 Tax=Metallosphaera TaxID=41980 RepID=UPI001EE10B77|nr:50S ribosomal protein L30e [Metallosphaera javensis (ex Hofmann et al. 2022)]MCG3107833.1 50S ribosomal protein L30e [Metallosphaera javensis (ex Hofmann et al. 2022)]BCS92015.1 MAG: 50S ribosomal protein L30e [Metallosphaera javensis (ex Sakai et al. 2022)]